MKRPVQRLVRGLHRRLLNRGLPARAAIYFHDLPQEHWDAFAETITYFRARGYRFTDPEAFFESGHEPRLFVSFDDNYRHWHQALPLFDELGLPATFYVNTLPLRDIASAADIGRYFDRLEFDGRRVPLNTAELRELKQVGHTVGNHTHSHQVLARLPLHEAEQEIRTASERLTELLGEAPAHFSYPYGMRRYFSEQLRELCRRMGFSTVANAIPGLQHCGQSRYGIQRSVWNLDQPFDYNLENLCIDGRHFERATGRAAAV